MRGATVLCVVLLCLATVRAEASFDNLTVVAQPMEDDGGVQLCYTTYILDFGNAWPGAEIVYTCSTAALLRPASRDSFSVEDGNVAHRAGIKIQVEDRYDPATWNSQGSDPPGARWGNRRESIPDPYVDTLLVKLDTQAAYDRIEQTPSRIYVDEFDRLVRVTIECIRDNASRSAIPIRHLKLVVTGPEQYRRLGGLLSIKPGVRTVH